MTRKKTRQADNMAEPLVQPASPDDTPRHGAAPHFPVVGIGASAGGLAAVETFFTNLPADAGTNMAFVLVQHLSPDHKSLLRELVQRYTRMTVMDITDEIRVEPNHVYVIPPSKDLELFHGTLHLMDPVTAHGLHLPIDAFFRSLAQDQQEHAICIVLSGAGSDGVLGVRAVKEVGGMIMAQAPETAEYASMPQSAIATGQVDYVLAPAELPDALVSYVKHALGARRHREGAPTAPVGELLQKIFILLRAQTRHDFSGYKPNTLHRRIERRMAIHHLETLTEYVHYLQQTPQEVQILFRELLIGVTRFFRDPEAFVAVSREVVARVFDNRQSGEAIRIWVPGCSTGEEAYSLAMLFREYAQERYAGVKITIFATDIDAVAIESARAGVYPANIAADVTPERLARFFHKDGNNYSVNKAIRDMVVFAEQDVILDPPFSHVDLISCRNLLIYLSIDVQKQLFPVFHYALKPRGFLFLGASESIGEFTDLFAPINRQWKTYQRNDVITPYRQFIGLAPRVATTQPTEKKPSMNDTTNLRALLEQYLLAHHTPAGVLINEAGDILFIHGSTGRFLEPAPGAANFNIKRMAREGLRLAVITTLQKAVTRNEAVRQTGIAITDNDSPVTINLLVTPLPSAPGLFVVIFVEAITTSAKRRPVKTSDADRDQRIIALEEELQAKEDYLQHNLEALTTANEELQSANEELQSTNEELDTSKEELQSVNEELSTVNAEMQRKIEELSLANDDMNNLLAGTDVGTVFIDQDLRIQRFTPAATAIVNLIPSDIGRPIAHLATNLVQYDTLLQDAQRVFETLEPREVDVQTSDGRWYLMRILPYRTQMNAIAGVVITFVNITAQRAMQEQLLAAQLAQQAHAFAESIVETIREPFLVLDADLRVASVNNAFTDTFNVQREDTVGALVYELGNGQWNIPKLRKLLEEVLSGHAVIHDYQVTHTFEQIGQREMRVNARELSHVNGQPPMILLAIDDVTEQTA